MPNIFMTIKLRMYPTKEQIKLFNQTIGCNRLLNNICLEQRKTYGHTYFKSRKITHFNQMKELPALKKEFSFFKDVPSQSLQQTILDLNKAFTNFFKNPKHFKFPKFKKKGDKNSFRYPDLKQIKFKGLGKNNMDHIPGDKWNKERIKVYLPKIGDVKVIVHREIVGNWKSATITEDGGQWYICILVEETLPDVYKLGNPLGLDLGVDKPATTSDGEIFYLPRISKEERKKLARLQRTMTRRTKGGKNREKARKKFAKLHAYFARKRKDAAHKMTTKIINSSNIVVKEALLVKNMTASAKGTKEKPGKNVRQKAGLNRTLLDIAFGQIDTMLTYKGIWYCTELIKVPAPGTSQTCSECLHREKGNRISQAEFTCLKCGHNENADVNAAKFILIKGLKQREL